MTESSAQAFLAVPGDLLDVVVQGAHNGAGWCRCCVPEKAVVPGSLNEYCLDTNVSGLDDGTALTELTGVVLRRNHSDVPHELARIGEAPKIAQLGAMVIAVIS